MTIAVHIIAVFAAIAAITSFFIGAWATGLICAAVVCAAIYAAGETE